MKTSLRPILSQGATTALLAPEITDVDARWLLHVLVDHWFEDIMPTHIPAHLVLITRLIIAEQDVIKSTMQDNHEKRVLAGRMGGLAKSSKPSNAKQSLAKSSKPSNAKHKIREDKIINNPEKEKEKEKAPLLIKGSVSESVINLSSSSVSVHYASDPVLYAMNLVGSKNQRDYQTFASFLRKVGMHTFCDVVNEFESQKHQGEMKSVRNLAAVLVTQLKKQPTI